jgi:hypothetical protein
MGLIVAMVLILWAVAKRNAPEGMVGAGAPMPPPLPPADGAACLVVAQDGRLSICVYQASDNSFAWRVTGEPGTGASGFDSRIAAKIAAWQALAGRDVGPLFSGVVTRAGLSAFPDGRIVVVDPIEWSRYAFAVLQAELNRGERDPWGLALAPLLSAFPNVNPFRWRPLGKPLAESIDRVRLPIMMELDALTADRIALALFGLSMSGNRFALHGRIVELASSTDLTGGGERWQYRIDGGEWSGMFPSRGDAIVAAANALAPVHAGVAQGG